MRCLITLRVTLPLALLATPAIAEPAANQFNLTCDGQIVSPGEPNRDYHSIYRIDLTKRVWCEGECKAVHPVAEIQPASVTLTETKDDDGNSDLNILDRETGRQHIWVTMLGSISKYEGQCERSQFGGFPSFQTRF